MRIATAKKAVGWLILPLLASSPAKSATCKLARILELPVTMEGMQPLVTVKINGNSARLVVDSGAFYSMITTATAAEFSLKTEPLPAWFYLIGVGGTVTPRLTTVKDFTIGTTSVHDVEFIVGGSQPGVAVGVMGQNVLAFADAEYDLGNGYVRLMRAHDCRDANLAYWTQGRQQPISVIEIEALNRQSPHTYGSVTVSGTKVRALFDTGVSTSMLSPRIAERLGVKLDAPGVVDGGYQGGIGRTRIRTWIAPFQSFQIGGEEIKNTRLRIGDTGNTADMLVGADFFLSHRIYVANSQHKLYLSYNGGPVFNLTVHPLSASSGAQVKEGEPELDAAGYARRGAAAAARRDFDDAIADLTHAIELDTQNGDYVRTRAIAYREKGDGERAAADLDQAIGLNPNDSDSLLLRAQWRFASANTAGATSDLDIADHILPEQADQRLAMGELYGHSDHFESAIRQLDLWIASHAQDSRFVSALNSRCWFSALGNIALAKGLEDCDRALDQSPKAPHILNSRAFLRLRMGQLDKSMADFNATLKLTPKDALSLYGRGIVELRKGLSSESQADLTTAAALVPNIADRARRYGFEP